MKNIIVKKLNPLFLFILVVLTVSSYNLQAQQVFHVAPDASKNAKGTLESPCNSVQSAQKEVAKINGKMSEDIIVYLHGGTYTLTSPLEFKEKDSGMNGHQIIYKTYENEVLIMSGGVQISGWEKVKGNIYKATFNSDSKLRTLFVNGKRMRMTGTEKIDAHHVQVWSDQVSSPEALCYAWDDNSDNAKLYNKEGLPAAPFRTDQWTEC